MEKTPLYVSSSPSNIFKEQPTQKPVGEEPNSRQPAEELDKTRRTKDRRTGGRGSGSSVHYYPRTKSMAEKGRRQKQPKLIGTKMLCSGPHLALVKSCLLGYCHGYLLTYARLLLFLGRLGNPTCSIEN